MENLTKFSDGILADVLCDKKKIKHLKNILQNLHEHLEISKKKLRFNAFQVGSKMSETTQRKQKAPSILLCKLLVGVGVWPQYIQTKHFKEAHSKSVHVTFILPVTFLPFDFMFLPFSLHGPFIILSFVF